MFDKWWISDVEAQDEESLLDWAQSMYSTSFEDHVANAEDSIRASLSVFTPWVERGSRSAQATLEATRSFRYFAAAIVVSLFFFGLAVFVGLPVLPLRPQKFAICFTLGSVAWMSSFALLRGWKSQLRMLCAKNRLVFTFAYFFTIFATLYAAVIRRSFIFTIVSSTAQFTTLLYYLGTFIPGGYRGVQLLIASISRTARFVLKPLLAGCVKCCMALVR